MFQSRFQDSLSCDLGTIHERGSWICVSVPFPGFTQLRLVLLFLPTPRSLFQSRFQDSLSCDHRLGDRFHIHRKFQSRFQDSLSCDCHVNHGCLILALSFSPVSRIHSVATLECWAEYYSPDGFQSRFQDSLSCDIKTDSRDSSFYYIVSVPFPGFTQLRPLAPVVPPADRLCFSPVSRIHSVATPCWRVWTRNASGCFSPVSRIHSVAT